MVGVTLSFGSAITVIAINQFNLSNYAALLTAGAQQLSAGKLLSIVYGTVTQSGSCPMYRGYNEGTAYTLAMYNYGTVSFTPIEVFVNSTLVSGSSYSSISAGGMTTYTLTLASCAHPSSQTFLLVDAYGDEVQVGT